MADEKKNEVLDQDDGTEEETKGGANQSAEDKSGDDGGGTENKGGAAKQEKTFTQEQVNRMMTREKNQGRAAVLRELGIDPKDTKAMAMVKALFESQKTDEQKAAEKAAADSEKQAADERRILVAEAKAEAMMLGVQPQYVEDVVDLALAKMAKSDDGADLKSIIGEYKTKYPVWFKADDKGGDNGAGKKAGQKGTGSSIKSDNGGKGGSESKGLGARLAAQRKSGVKSSYWGKR